LDEVIGATFIGCLVTAILYGVTCLQAVLFLLYSSSSMKFIKVLVLMITSLNTAHMALVSNFTYTLIVTDFGNVLKLGTITWSLAASFLVSNASDTIIRVFFARRVWLLSGRSIPVTIFTALVVLFSFVITLISNVDVLDVALGGGLQRRPKDWLLNFNFAIAAVADLWIAAALCFYLHKSRSSNKGTNCAISTLGRYTIDTGLIATVLAIGCLIANALALETYVFLAFYLPLSKVYVNAFLGSLDVRESIRESSDSSESTYSSRNPSRMVFVSPEHQRDTSTVGSIDSRSDTPEGKFISIQIDTESSNVQVLQMRHLSTPV